MKFGTLIRLKKAEDCIAAFEKVQAMGLESCQLVFKPQVYTLEDARFIKEQAQKAGVEISAFFAGFQDDYTAWELKYDFCNAGLNSAAFGESRLQYVVSALPFIKELGVEDVIVHAGFVPNNPFAPEYASLLCMVRLLAERAKTHGLNILLETGGESPVSLLRLIQDVATGNVFVNLDTGNLIMYGYGNPCDALFTIGKYVRNVHAKDGVPPSDPYKIGAEKAIGEGVVDFKRFFALLKNLGYDRYVTIEREIEGEEQKKDIEKGFICLKKAME